MNSRRVCAVFLVPLCLALFFAGCAKKVSPEVGAGQVAPGQSAENVRIGRVVRLTPAPIQTIWKGLNRKVFSFNDVLISYVFTPVHIVYAGFFPPDVRNGFSNFYRNLAFRPLRERSVAI